MIQLYPLIYLLHQLKISLAESVAKESQNMGAKKLNDDVLVDAGLSLLDKNIKNNFINYRLRNNSNKPGRKRYYKKD